MTAPSCSLAPQIAGEDSKMYTDLLELTNDRPTTNYIYALYLQQGVDAQMDSLGYKRNKQNQHSAKDTAAFFDLIQMDAERSKLENDRIVIGDVVGGNKQPIALPVEALKKAKDYNDTHKGTMATINFDGNNYWYFLGNRDHNSISSVDSINKNLKVWEFLSNYINSKFNINFEDLTNNNTTNRVVNPVASINLTTTLYNITQTDNKYLDLPSIQTLLMINANHAGVQRILNHPSINNDLNIAAQEIKNVLAGTSSSPLKLLINRTISSIKKLSQIDFNYLQSEVGTIVRAEHQNAPGQIKDTIKNLANNFNIELNEVSVKLRGNKETINTLKSAASEALMTLQIRKKELQKKQNKSSSETEELKLLRKDLQSIALEISNKKYDKSCIKFLENTSDKIGDLQNLLADLNITLPNALDTAIMRASIMHDITDIFDGYLEIVEALASIDNLDDATAVDVVTRQSIQVEAQRILDDFKDARTKANSLQQAIMQSLLSEILGTTHDGKLVSTLLSEANMDSSWYTNLYAFTRSGNDLVSAMGTITREAQRKRDRIKEEYRRKLVKADRELRAASPIGRSSTEFMYEKDNKHIISFITDVSAPSGYSSIDWDAYDAAKQSYKEYLESQNKTPEEVYAELKDWEYKNTTAYVVDMKNGRSERIPNHNYRKVAPTLTQAQKNYYDTVMALKAELESTAPTTAQDYFRPPQVKRNIGDVLFNPRSPKDFIKGVGTHIADNFRFTENDQMTIPTTSGNVIKTDINYRGEEKKEIPIFHITRLSNPNELLTDFTSALQSQMASMVNYSTMNQVVNAVEFMKDYIHDNITPIKNTRGKTRAEILQNKFVMAVQKAVPIGRKNGMSDIIESYLGMQFYGEKIENADAVWTAPILKLIGYSSVKNLALNIKGAVSNAVMGEVQDIIEACGGEFFNVSDYIWAHGLLFGSVFKDLGGAAKPIIGKDATGRLVDMFTGDVTNYEMLLSREFGMMPDYGRNVQRYYRNPIRAIIGHIDPMGGYAIGEHLIHHVNGFAILNHTKVLIDGKKSTLYHAFNVIGGSKAPHLELKANVTDLQGNPITSQDIDHIRKIILYVNQSCHGGMTDEEKGALAQKLIGRSVLNFRQWMIETYSRRYRDTHYDGTIGEHRTGYMTDTRRLLHLCKKKNAIKWSDATPQQKANFKRAAGAIGITVITLALSEMCYGLLSAPFKPQDDEEEDDDEDEVVRSYMSILGEYTLRKTLMDMVNTDFGIVGAALTFKTLANSIVPAMKTLNGLMYIPLGLLLFDWLKFKNYPTRSSDDEEEDEEEDDLENVYLHNTLKYAVPFYKDIKEIMDPSIDILKVLDVDMIFR